jgi:hypothetical protein
MRERGERGIEREGIRAEYEPPLFISPLQEFATLYLWLFFAILTFIPLTQLRVGLGIFIGLSMAPVTFTTVLKPPAIFSALFSFTA